MNTLMSKTILLTALISLASLAAEKSSSLKTNQKTELSAQTNAAAIAAEKSAVNRIIEAVLNQVQFARIDFDISFSSTTKVVNGKETSEFALKFLEVPALIKFKDQVTYRFVEENKANPQLKEIIPYIVFSTKEMTVIAKASIAAKGNFTVRFCQSYSINNDYCNTFDDQKLLHVSVKNSSFGSIFDLYLKDITLNFDPRLKDGKTKFSGWCTALKNAFDATTVTPSLKPALCEFSGEYDSSRKQKFNFDFTFKTKTP